MKLKGCADERAFFFVISSISVSCRGDGVVKGSMQQARPFFVQTKLCTKIEIQANGNKTVAVLTQTPKRDQDVVLTDAGSMIGPCSVAPSPGVAGRGGCIRSGEDLEVLWILVLAHGSRCSKTASGLFNRRALATTTLTSIKC